MQFARLRPVVALLIVVLFASVLGGCTIAKISGAGPRPLLLNNPAEKYDVIKHFTIEEQSTFDYTNSAEIDRLVASVLSETGADAIANLRVTVKYTPADYCMNSITCGLASARTWAIEGDAVKFK
ncbi:MAG: hypothetical protein ACOYOB_10410 [Myxococcota bacterium]